MFGSLVQGPPPCCFVWPWVNRASESQSPGVYSHYSGRPAVFWSRQQTKKWTNTQAKLSNVKQPPGGGAWGWDQGKIPVPFQKGCTGQEIYDLVPETYSPSPSNSPKSWLANEANHKHNWLLCAGGCAAAFPHGFVPDIGDPTLPNATRDFLSHCFLGTSGNVPRVRWCFLLR